MEPSKPHLYTSDPDDGTGPQLKGGTCFCGHVFFPWQTYGCEKCGATGSALRPTLLDGKGTLVASARVHMHGNPSRTVPFVVSAVRLASGPVVRALLAEDSEQHYQVGHPMQACLVQIGKTDSGAPTGELRFTPLQSQQ